MSEGSNTGWTYADNVLVLYGTTSYTLTGANADGRVGHEHGLDAPEDRRMT